MAENNKKIYSLGWSLIPPYILKEKNLSANEKLIWGRINGLTTTRGYCFASNQWLGEQLGLTSGTVSNIISSLTEKKFLKREISRDENGKVTERRLYSLPIKQWGPPHSLIDTPPHSLIENRDRDKRNRDNNIRKTKSFPRKDYDLVLDAYQKYKGIKLSGPEFLIPQRAIKTMFKANRKPEEIVGFMKWLHNHERDERTSWVKMWTIWTVQKKIAEFIAGKLKLVEMEDEFPRYGK